MVALSNAMIALHKEQFGRGPTRARSDYGGADTVVCVLEDALVPAERAMVGIGADQRVRELRLLMQEATRERFVAAAEEITGRKVRAFCSASDPPNGVAVEVFVFEPA